MSLIQRGDGLSQRKSKVVQNFLSDIIITDFKVQMRTSGIARTAYITDDLPLADLIADTDIVSAQMGIKCGVAVSVIDDNTVSVASVIGCFGDNA